ncbi:MAG: hypothetical protein Q8O67_31670 [Deltaproteobacteria bacterium]|nr:hypothetical protein [Deltaproteobacteria bacterium]
MVQGGTAARFTNDVGRPYQQRRELLLTSFPAAHAFLVAIEKLHTDVPGFHLGTSQNIHVYLHTRYLAYIKLRLGIPGAPRLLLRAKQHVAIKNGTIPDPALFGPALRELVTSHGGFQDGWAEQPRPGKEEQGLTRDTPAAFFDELLVKLRSLATPPPR